MDLLDLNTNDGDKSREQGAESSEPKTPINSQPQQSNPVQTQPQPIEPIKPVESTPVSPVAETPIINTPAQPPQTEDTMEDFDPMKHITQVTKSDDIVDQIKNSVKQVPVTKENSELRAESSGIPNKESSEVRGESSGIPNKESSEVRGESSEVQKPELHPETILKPIKETKSNIKLIIGLVVLFIAVGVGVYFYFFYKATLTINVNPSSAQIQIGDSSSVGSVKVKLKPGSYHINASLTDYVTYDSDLTLKPSSKLTLDINLLRQSEPVRVVDYPATFFTPSADYKSLLYLSNQGSTIYKIDQILADSKQIPYAVTPKVFANVTDIKWHPGKFLAIVKQNNRWFYYDFNRYDLLNQDIQELPEGIGDIVWSPTGDKIIYYYSQGDEKTLRRADKDNSNSERIVNLKDINITNPKLRWSADGKKVLLVDNSIYILDVYTKVLTQLAQFESISDATFTPDSQFIVYEKDQKLYRVDLKGENRQDLNIATPLSKTTWLDQNSLMYFITQDGTDQLFSFNLSSNKTVEYTYKKGNIISAKNLYISSDKNKVFYNQGEDLYSLKLVKAKY